MAQTDDQDIATTMSKTRSTYCDSLQPRLAAYALGEVQPDADLAAHLAECATCPEDVRRYKQVARILPFAAPDVAPPPELRARILAAANPDATATAVSTKPPAPRRSAASRRSWLLWGVACATLLALLGWNVSLRSQLQTYSTQVAKNRDNWQTMTELLNDPTVRSVALTGDSVQGHIWVAQDGEVGCLVVQGLPEPGADKVFQVWLRSGNQPVGVATFEARGGSAWTFIRADQSIAEFDAIGVTIEPRGGSPTPTGQRVLFGTLEALGSSQASSVLPITP